MAAIVEARVSAARGGGEIVQRRRLGPAHVGAEAAKEHRARLGPVAATIGDVSAAAHVGCRWGLSGRGETGHGAGRTRNRPNTNGACLASARGRRKAACRACFRCCQPGAGRQRPQRHRYRARRAEAGAVSLVASAGGPLARDLLRSAGAKLIDLPLASRNPFLLRRARRLSRIIREQGVRHRPCARAGRLLERLPRGSAAGRAFPDHLRTRSMTRGGPAAPLHRGHGQGRPGHRVSQFLADHIREPIRSSPAASG